MYKKKFFLFIILSIMSLFAFLVISMYETMKNGVNCLPVEISNTGKSIISVYRESLSGNKSEFKYDEEKYYIEQGWVKNIIIKVSPEKFSGLKINLGAKEFNFSKDMIYNSWEKIGSDTYLVSKDVTGMSSSIKYFKVARNWPGDINLVKKILEKSLISYLNILFIMLLFLYLLILVPSKISKGEYIRYLEIIDLREKEILEKYYIKETDHFSLKKRIYLYR